MCALSGHPGPPTRFVATYQARYAPWLNGTYQKDGATLKSEFCTNTIYDDNMMSGFAEASPMALVEQYNTCRPTST